MTPRARSIVGPILAITMSLAIAFAIYSLVGRRETLPLHFREMELLAPRWLYLLALLPYLWLVKGASLADFSRPQQAISVGVRWLLVAALALALARPSQIDERKIVCTVVMVDTSDSVSDRQLDDARKFLEELRASQGDNQLHLITFAGRAHVVPLPTEKTQNADTIKRPTTFGEKGDGSDLQAALQLAYGLYPPGVIRRAVLLSDGNQTEGDLLAESYAAARHGVRLSVRPFAAEHDDEVLVRELNLPAGVRLGAPFAVSAEIYASRAVDAILTLYQDDFVNPLDGRRAVHLQAGRNAFTFKSSVADPGFVTYKLAVSGLPADFKDRFPANNSAVSSVAVKGRPRVLYVEGEP